jgi:hypothetical protein
MPKGRAALCGQATFWKALMTHICSQSVFAIGRDHLKPYASAYHEIPETEYTTCGLCHRVSFNSRAYKRSLIWLEAERGGRKCIRGELGDFTWHGRDDEAIISNRLRCVLNPFLQRYTLRETQSELNFEVPNINSGEPIWELTDLPVAHVDLTATGAELISVCPECGDRIFNFTGEMKLVINRESWDQWDLFSVDEFQMMFVTEAVFDCLQQFGATNFRVRRAAVLS